MWHLTIPAIEYFIVNLHCGTNIKAFLFISAHLYFIPTMCPNFYPPICYICKTDYVALLSKIFNARCAPLLRMLFTSYYMALLTTHH